ncbi:M1 family metallopeptidase [Pedobacter frigoris]|uniref:M1 family metallopeptidase n=1 Tax=Pedobacter frigoris TaxID=2571272 RepID=UPI001CECFEBA|nr:M1 family aminopeptidase [Pedobacter frigoris]
MVHFRYTLVLLSVCLLSFSWIDDLPNPKLETGVSKALAAYRKSVLSQLNYKLSLDIPADKASSIAAKARVSFQLKTNKHPLQLDFKERTENIKKIVVNGKAVTIVHSDEHIVIEPKYLKSGKNIVDLEFIAGNGALNRNADYLYALFVPDRARTVFPCFDQPDLKATYDLTLSMPNDWTALANAKLKDSLLAPDRRTYVFNTSDTLSTYLFSFVAGKFKTVYGKTGRMTSEFLYRETDSVKIRQSVPEIFKIHSESLDYFEKWTGIPYPFQKFGFSAIPDFQFGGMEHPGTIHYKASTFFLDGGATKDQLNSRTHLIAHETAHMWFGDLVTMNWFTDVWMKEVFANFMADKSTEGSEGANVFDLKFLIDHFPAAYGIDRTTGANPIRQPLDNLKDAGTLYGNIIYHKSPIMMRQLERLMGKEKFQTGVREYLRKFSNGNASWPDLITILDRYASADLQKWNKVWVDEPGRPVIHYDMQQENGKIKKFSIMQSSEYGAKRYWPQLFELKLIYPNYSKEITVDLNAD